MCRTDGAGPTTWAATSSSRDCRSVGIHPLRRERPPRERLGMSRLDAVVFDLNGVLLDSEERWDAVRQCLAADAGLSWPAGATQAMLGMNTAEWSQSKHLIRGDDDDNLTPARQEGHELKICRMSIPGVPCNFA
jgi:hypothetical protein